MADSPTPTWRIIVDACLTTVAGITAALVAYGIVRGVPYQPNNCYVETSTKVVVLGILGGVVLLLSLGTSAYGATSLVRRRPRVMFLTALVVIALAASLFWAFIGVAAFGC